MTDEERESYLMRRYYEKSIEQLENWKREGLTKEEAKLRINRKVLNDDDIDKVYGKDKEQSKITNVEESTQTKEKNEKELNFNKTDVTGEILTKTEKITKEIS